MPSNMRLFTSEQWASVKSAIGQEIAESKKDAETTWLELDGIDNLGKSSSGHKYRLLVSHAPRVSAEQVLSFHIRGGETITARVIEARDQELVVVCDKQLPSDAKLLRLSFDPTFIYRALEEFLNFRQDAGTRLARCILTHQFPPRQVSSRSVLAQSPQVQGTDRLNISQQKAIEAILNDELHLLWGPPGTGKTTTLGVAIGALAEMGRRTLILSTSNAAVDVAMKAVIKSIPNRIKKRWVCRIGDSEDPQVSRLADASWFLRSGPLRSRVCGCTLARLVLDEHVKMFHYDYVVIDEVSMVGLLYVLAAASLDCDHLVCAGDPMQLPPICQSDQKDAQLWLGQSIYDWYEVDSNLKLEDKPVVFLDTQYRMTKTIGELVSVTGYAGRLQTGRQVQGAPIEFVDVPREWQQTFYSVAYASYYHPLAVALLHEICPCLPKDREILALSPFRPQQALLAAIGFDLTTASPNKQISASTIHRAQGSERRCVILDLTTHDPAKLVRFFKDRHAERLVNVAISRAQDHLVVIGNQNMLHSIAAKAQGITQYWKELLLQFDRTIQAYSAREIVSPIPWSKVETQLRASCDPGKPVMISTFAAGGELEGLCKLATSLKGYRKVVVAPTQPPLLGDYIARASSDCPPFVAAGDVLAIPLDGQWLSVDSPSVSRTIWRIGFKHIVEPEVAPADLAAFDCPKCGLQQGLVIRFVFGMGTRLVCLNRPTGCFHDRPLSIAAARLKARAANIKCPYGHPATVRSGAKGLFLACENYPACDWSDTIKLLDGM